jgi:RNA polymerase sigma-70 factor (ECF subfamily)
MPAPGEQERFAAAFEAHSRAILAYALRRVDEPADAADIVAETFLVAWRRIGDLPRGEDCRPWLYGVARLVLANQRRGRLRHAALGEKLRAAVARLDPIAIDGTADAARAVHAALARLGSEDRELLTLANWERLSPAEIAVVLGIPAGTARTRLHRARGRLREHLQAIGWREARTLEPGRTSTGRRQMPFEGREEEA